MSWLEIAKELPVGKKTYVDCECGSGRTLTVSNHRKVYSNFCFRCGRNDYEYKGKSSLEELARIRELNNKAAALVSGKPRLPRDFTTDIPLEGRLWLYKASITESMWEEHGIGYSKELDRVVVPSTVNGELVWYQCRALHKGQQPKYLQPSTGRGKVLHKVNKNTKTAVIVEDMLSSIRVGAHMTTYALMGTSMTIEQAMLLADHDDVITWFDDDAAGKKCRNNVTKLLSLTCNMHNISTRKDPKNLSNREIVEELRQCGL